MILSQRAKEAFKMGLIVVLALALAQSFGWERPDWAVFMAILANLGFAGASYLKGLRGILGTALALPILWGAHALFPQERWPFLILLSALITGLFYLTLTRQDAYIWQKTISVMLIIGVGGNLGTLDSTHLFNLSVARLQETVLGVVVFVLVQSLLWPNSGRPELLKTSAQLLLMQRQLISACFTSLLQKQPIQGINDQPGALIDKLNALRGQSHDVKLENGRSFEERFAWQHIAALGDALMPTLLELLNCRQQLKNLPLTDYLPGLPEFVAELDARLAHAHALHLGPQASRACRNIELVERQQLADLDVEGRVALSRLHQQLGLLQSQTQQLIEQLEAIFLFTQPLPQRALHPAPKSGIDWEVVQMAGANLGLFWLAIFLWINFTLPGGSTLLMMSVLIAMSAPFMSRLPTKMYSKLLIPFMLIATIQVIFILPHLSEFYQLALFLGGNISLNWYLFKQPAMRVVASIMLLMLGSSAYANPPVFSALSTFTTLLMLLLMLLCHYLVIELLVPMEPGRQVLRTRTYLLLRFRHDFLQFLPPQELNTWDSLARKLPVCGTPLLAGRYGHALQQWSAMKYQVLSADNVQKVAGNALLIGMQQQTLLRCWQQAQPALHDPTLRQPFERAAKEAIELLKLYRQNPSQVPGRCAWQKQHLREQVEHELKGRALAADSPLFQQIGDLLHAWGAMYDYFGEWAASSETIDWPRVAEARF
jgi:uncharacterized membrane protein YgaE (UPF0421/DUF939 family)